MFTENELVRIAYDVLHGLGYLHRLGMPHLCLHSSCIMICSDGTTKLGRHS
jgi:serine/threonine protein kinase